MLKRSIKRIFGFFPILAKNKKIKFFGQIIKLILQSINSEKDLTNFHKFWNSTYWQGSEIREMLKIQKNYKNGSNKRQNIQNTFIWPFFEQILLSQFRFV